MGRTHTKEVGRGMSKRYLTDHLPHLPSSYPRTALRRPPVRLSPPTDWPEPTKEKLTLTFPPLMMQA